MSRMEGAMWDEPPLVGSGSQLAGQFVSFEDRVLQGARREAIADQLDASRLPFQLFLQARDRLAAVGVDERTVRAQHFLALTPDVDGDGLARLEPGHAQVAMELRALREEPLEDGRRRRRAKEGGDGPLAGDEVDFLAPIEQVLSGRRPLVAVLLVDDQYAGASHLGPLQD